MTGTGEPGAGCAEIAVAAPVATTLHYRLGPESAGRLRVGMRCLVPLGRRRVTGYCLGVDVPPPPEAQGRLKPVAQVLDPEPLFPPVLVPLYRWLADYYCHPIGEVVRECLPGGLVRASGREIVLTAAGRDVVSGIAAGEEDGWAAELLASGTLSAAQVKKLWPRLGSRWQAMAARGEIEIRPVLAGGRLKIKTEIRVRLTAAGEAALAAAEQGTLGKAARRTLATLAQLAPAGTPVPRPALNRAYGSAGRCLAGLAAAGLVALEEGEVHRDPLGLEPVHYPPPERLSAEQEAVLARVLPAVTARRFAAFLLHGVTGAGKTEVYLRAAARCLELGRSVLVLVPEIALASQLEAHFHARFGDRVALLHSGLSSGERYDQWRQVAAGRKTVVIGARSAVFAPLADPGLIIVDEEHDPAYKQEDGLRYHGRDVAVFRGRLHQAVVLLGSATPSVASYTNAGQGKYHLLTMGQRVGGGSLPTVEIVDLRACPRQDGQLPLFSPQLAEALEQNLAAGNQALVFLNRRGFANFLVCRDCGATVTCRHCQVSLTLHKHSQQLVCHYCGFQLPAASLCPSCRNPNLVAVGFGTERLEEEVARLLPDARVARLDRDTVASRRLLHHLLARVHRREIDVLVGTQMITKGHHFPGVTLVGVVFADGGLGLPDFRAGERTYQLLAQVLGRAGRGETPGRVVVQTVRPDHYAVVCARDHDYESFYRQEVAFRRALGYPPFCRMVCFVLESTDDKAAADAGRQVAARLAEVAGLAVLGPAPAPLARLRGRFRYQVVARAGSTGIIHRGCRHLLAALPKGCRGGKVRLQVDVDPESML